MAKPRTLTRKEQTLAIAAYARKLGVPVYVVRGYAPYRDAAVAEYLQKINPAE
jgi:hypothetical protein